MTVEELRTTIETVKESLEGLIQINESYVDCNPDKELSENDALDVGEVLLDLEKEIY